MNGITEQSSPDNKLMMTIIWFIVGVMALVFAFVIGISDNLPGILLLLFGCFSVLYALLHRLGKSKNLRPGQKLLYWSPRVLCIVFAAFTALFAMDVFDGSRGFWETLLALFMHLIPTFALIAVLVVSWRWEWIGGVVFILLAVLYAFSIRGRFPLLTYIAISGPLVIIGILFLLNWRYRNSLRPNSKC